MAELRKIECPECGQPNQPKSVADGIQEYRCLWCGMVYCGPCGCAVDHDDGLAAQPGVTHEAPPLPEGWSMSGRVFAVERCPASHSRPGGC